MLSKICALRIHWFHSYTNSLVSKTLTTGIPYIEYPDITNHSVLDNLISTDIALSNHTITLAELGQLHALVSKAITMGVPVISIATLKQIHQLVSLGLATGNTVIDKPVVSSFSIVNALVSKDIVTGNAVISLAIIAQTNALIAKNLSATAFIDKASLIQLKGLVSKDITTGIPYVNISTLGVIHKITTNDIITGAISIAKPIITQTNALVSKYIITGTNTIIEKSALNYVLDNVFYVDTAGSDLSTRNGSIGQEWKTVAYAATRVTTPAKIIHVNAGTYNEIAKITLAPGVSLEGAGVITNIISTYANSSDANYSITMYSASLTNGNQYVRNLNLDGASLVGLKGILVYGRHNVSVYGVTITNFKYAGISFTSTNPYTLEDWVETTPFVNYATGNKLYNCTINNCSTRVGSGVVQGNVILGGQSGMEIYGNTFIQKARITGENGNIFNAYPGQIKDLYVYDNYFEKSLDEGTEFNFHIEFGNSNGNIQVYNNEFKGGGQMIDLGGTLVRKGTSIWAWHIHHNLFWMESQLTVFNDPISIGIDLERSIEYILVEYNHFKNIGYGIGTSLRDANRKIEYITIRYNIFENIGYNTTLDWWGNHTQSAINFSDDVSSNSFSHIYIHNNDILTTGTAIAPVVGINMIVIGTMSYVEIINNIIRNCTETYLAFRDLGTKDNILVENNITYLNGNSNNHKVYEGPAPTNLTVSGNIKSNPLFVGTTDFHLQVGSPAINAGINLGITPDYDGVAVGNPPEIGIYEYV